jgi:hypothetical protein
MGAESHVTVFAATCPHCRRPFRAELLAGGSARRGFKCPHCCLFVPAERAGAGAAPKQPDAA